MPSKLKGTMVGVAPMMAISARGGPAPVAVPSATGQQRAAPGGLTPQAGMGAGPAAPGAGPLGATPPPGGAPAGFSPPYGQQGVNPLGGTVAADTGSFAKAFSPTGSAPAGGVGGGAAPHFAAARSGTIAMPVGPALPPAGSTPYGAAPVGTPPPGQSPVPMPYDPAAFGATQSAYGGSPGGAQAPYGGASASGQPSYGGQAPAAQDPYGAPQNPYGAGTQQGEFGAGSYNVTNQAESPGGAMAQYDQDAPVEAGASGPTRRNALMTWLMPVAVFVGGLLLCLALWAGVDQKLLSLFPIFALVAVVWGLVSAIGMVNEVRAVTRNADFAWWPVLIPGYNIYWAWILVPQEVARAKQALGVSEPPRSIVLYVLFWHYALASDVNDMVR